MGECNCVDPYDDDRDYVDNVVIATVKKSKPVVAMDSGSCENVVRPDDLTDDVKVISNAPAV